MNHNILNVHYVKFLQNSTDVEVLQHIVSYWGEIHTHKIKSQIVKALEVLASLTFDTNKK